MTRSTASNELEHRLRNLLAIVDAITRRTLTRSPEDRAIADTLSIRFAAVAAANDVLSDHPRGADICDIVDDALTPFGLNWDGRICVEGPPTPVEPGLSLVLRMVLHEMATNAVKYGALSNENGRVSVRWAVSAPYGEALAFSWVERSGFKLKRPRPPGFGSLMIRDALKYHVVCPPELSFSSDGLRFDFTARLSRDRDNH